MTWRSTLATLGESISESGRALASSAQPSCRTGARGDMASSTFVTAGKRSYVTVMSLSASSATWGLVAATAAIGCPLYSAIP